MESSFEFGLLIFSVPYTSPSSLPVARRALKDKVVNRHLKECEREDCYTLQKSVIDYRNVLISKLQDAQALILDGNVQLVQMYRTFWVCMSTL